MNRNAICNVAVLDMQPIDPPVGGGRLRLFGLYHDLGENFSTTYVGTYDWPGEKYRDHHLTATLREIDIPLTDQHFDACRKWQERVNGKILIDVTFHKLVHLSPAYLDQAKKLLDRADVVIFSHPWIYPVVRENIRAGQLIVYDSHNVEGFLRFTLLDDNGGEGTEIVREVARVESELCRSADLVIACSQEDRDLFYRLYKIPFEKIRIVPNGVFTCRVSPAPPAVRNKAKKALGIREKKCAIFIGSSYVPNREAAEFIHKVLAPRFPDMMFVIAGGVGAGIDKLVIRDKGISNVRVTGYLDEKTKMRYLSASDMAVNPMFGGSGTNIKMFDFMAAGLPIITTPVGARGIETGAEDAFMVYEKEDFSGGVSSLLDDPAKMSSLSQSARKVVEEKYSWERISPGLGILLHRLHAKKVSDGPFFSVIVPSYERPEFLLKLMDGLRMQTFRDFEVIVVDQSKNLWPNGDEDLGLDFLYIHTDVKGAVKARNRGAFYASGKVLAYIDDDCMPSKNWLKNARPYFDKPDVIGVEGFIRSDKMDDPRYRTVTNEGFEGIGFLTANLFLKLDIFNAINGFDEAFDNPHFREDSDLGWRALEYGKIPFAKDVMVFHPPHLRSVGRESLDERNAFFEKDALLLKKHPVRYRELFLREGHWRNTPGFWENFIRGASKYGVDLSEYGFLKKFGLTDRNFDN